MYPLDLAPNFLVSCSKSITYFLCERINPYLPQATSMSRNYHNWRRSFVKKYFFICCFVSSTPTKSLLVTRISSTYTIKISLLESRYIVNTKWSTWVQLKPIDVIAWLNFSNHVWTGQHIGCSINIVLCKSLQRKVCLTSNWKIRLDFVTTTKTRTRMELISL